MDAEVQIKECQNRLATLRAKIRKLNKQAEKVERDILFWRDYLVKSIKIREAIEDGKKGI